MQIFENCPNKNLVRETWTAFEKSENLKDKLDWSQFLAFARSMKDQVNMTALALSVAPKTFKNRH